MPLLFGIFLSEDPAASAARWRSLWLRLCRTSSPFTMLINLAPHVSAKASGKRVKFIGSRLVREWSAHIFYHHIFLFRKFHFSYLFALVFWSWWQNWYFKTQTCKNILTKGQVISGGPDPQNSLNLHSDLCHLCFPACAERSRPGTKRWEDLVMARIGFLVTSWCYF